MPNVKLTKNVAVDLYAVTGISNALRLQVSAITSSDVRLSTIEAGLKNDHITLPPYHQATNDLTDTEAWAVSTADSAVNVRGLP